ncbi:hypothetical protein HB364_15105 [Pseudoflavitalea sp. X16]|uniref:hypothetical protein n=1 Tax=Paraflavitalea devenefica TaxID=2716334 RepID=UPI00142131FE|nr:hypothetical protein [Paraflavitalea devenefica]NII26416.1 hypothetical protein [Paraflavitalea devenefica]
MKPFNTKVKVVVLLAAIIIAYFGWQAHRQDSELKEQKRREQDQITNIRNHITSFVLAERNSYQYSNLGGIYGLSIKVQNKTIYIIDKVTVKVSYLKPSGEVWKDKFVEFYYVEPWKMVENKVADEPRGVRIEYKIVSITSRSLGLL